MNKDLITIHTPKIELVLALAHLLENLKWEGITSRLQPTGDVKYRTTQLNCTTISLPGFFPLAMAFTIK